MLTKIDSEVLETPAARNTSGDAANLFSESGHSLASIFANVNPQDGRFLKYLLDGFLNEDQKTAKAAALQKQADEYANYRATEDNTQSLSQEDSAYLSTVKSGDMETAQRMVDEAAKAAMPDSKAVDKDGNLLYIRQGTVLCLDKSQS